MTTVRHADIIDAVRHTMPNRARVPIVGDSHYGSDTLHKNRHCRKEMELNTARTQLHRWLENIGAPTSAAAGNLRMINALNSIGRKPPTATTEHLSVRCEEVHKRHEQERLLRKAHAL